MDGMSTEAIAAMLVGGLGVLGGVVAYLFRMLVQAGQRRIADVTAHYERLLADKDQDIAGRDAEIARLNATVSELRDRPPPGAARQR